MTRSELASALAARAGISVTLAERVVASVFDSMGEALLAGDGVEIRGFGSFRVRAYKPYAGRNPRTGEPVAVQAKRTPFFKVGRELRALVAKGRPALSGTRQSDE